MSSERDQYTQNFHYTEKINSIKTQFFSALDDFKKYYVYYNTNPEVDEYQKNYENSKTQIQQLNDKLMQITCDINENIDNLDSDMDDIVKKIEVQKELNKTLTDTLNSMESTQTGSQVLIDDYKKKYNEQYYKNIQLYFGILIMLTMLAILSGNTSLVTILKVLNFLTVIVLIYNLSITYTFILFFLFISIFVAIMSFWK